MHWIWIRRIFFPETMPSLMSLRRIPPRHAPKNRQGTVPKDTKGRYNDDMYRTFMEML